MNFVLFYGNSEIYSNFYPASFEIDGKTFPTSEHYFMYVLKDGSKIIAVASASSFDELGELPWSVENTCELARIGVRPELQGQGLGTVILKKVIEAVKARGYGGIRMLVAKNNPAALAMYDKNGFERLGETNMYDIDFYCYQMRFANIGTLKEKTL